MAMYSNKHCSKLKVVFKYTVFAMLLSLVLLNFVTLSPQWCLSKERVWCAEEIDLIIFVSEEYETKPYECFNLFDRDELNQYVTGILKIGGKVSHFTFEGEDNFKWIQFGNIDDINDETWDVTGEFKLVFNSKKIRFMINSISGDFFPKNIAELTFVPLYDYEELLKD